MKKNFEEGVNNLTKLLNNFNNEGFLQPLIHCYRAYGYFCLSDIPVYFYYIKIILLIKNVYFLLFFIYLFVKNVYLYFLECIKRL